MSNTLAIHWIATTHGTWLHGDVRGSWRDGRLIGVDPFLEESIRQRMNDDAVVLSQAEVVCISATIGQIIREQKHRVYAATIQATHLHIVFAPMAEDVKTAIARFKKRTADLVLNVRRKRGDDRRHLWTTNQFPVYIFTEDHLLNVIEYVREHNLHCRRQADPYDWIEPLYKPGKQGRQY